MKKLSTIFATVAGLLVISSASAHHERHSAKVIYQQVHPSVYPIYVLSRTRGHLESVGSSVAITPTTLVTNCHVLHEKSRVVIESKGRAYRAKRLKTNKHTDVCLLQVKGVELHDVPIRLSATVPVGEQVYAIGNPKGSIKSITTGIVSNKRKVKGGLWLQTDATISFGSSGGGLFDDEGRLIGITTALHGRFGYALPTEWVVGLLNRTK